MGALYDQIVIPEDRRKTSLTREQAAFLFEFLNGRGITRTLETGFAYGCSTVHIMKATGAPHIAIDPYEEGYENLGLANVTRLGLHANFEHVRLPSHVALPRLLERGIGIDFALIDGGHKFDEIFVDWYYIGLLLNRGGFVMFDDAWLEATRMVADFLRLNRKDFRPVDGTPANLLLFEKVDRDRSEWTDFQPFGLTRG